MIDANAWRWKLALTPAVDLAARHHAQLWTDDHSNEQIGVRISAYMYTRVRGAQKI